jgi:hypothetical protein
VRTQTFESEGGIIAPRVEVATTSASLGQVRMSPSISDFVRAIPVPHGETRLWLCVSGETDG